MKYKCTYIYIYLNRFYLINKNDFTNIILYIRNKLYDKI